MSHHNHHPGNFALIKRILLSSISLWMIACCSSCCGEKNKNPISHATTDPTSLSEDEHFSTFSSFNEKKKKILQVHIVPHTHDDVGWLKTVDQYYYGRNNTIQHACVSCILDSVMDALQRNTNRTFTYVEMAFFSMWWEEQTIEMKRRVKQLIQKGQLSFVNGGWCMHDEATTHYMGMIDQMTLGHTFLKSQFNYIPTVGWQLDPFGHSKFHAWMSRQMGFNSLYFGRIDHVDLKIRQDTQLCESLWQTSSSSLSSSSSSLDSASSNYIFFSLTGSYKGNYGPPIQGFCFDVNCQDEPLMGLTQDELITRIQIFLNALKVQASRTRGNHILITMGEDFQYENAFVNFKNIDLLIDTLNQLPLSYLQSTMDDSQLDGIHVFYSNPNMYTQAKYHEWKQENITNNIPIKDQDFFPYSDCDHCYWSGYYSSRPVLKRLDRFSSAFLNAARKIDVLGYLHGISHMDSSTCLNVLERASGILQHHDGVSGTAKQHVADDYTRKIYEGIHVTAAYLSTIVTNMLQPRSDVAEVVQDTVHHIPLNFTYCDTSTCVVSSSSSSSPSDSISTFFAIFNPLSFKSDDLISISISSMDDSYIVENFSNGSWVSVPCSQMDHSRKGRRTSYLLYFKTNQPALGFSMYRITTTPVKVNRDDIQKNMRNQISSNFASSDRLRRGLMSSHSMKDNSGNLELRTSFFTIRFKRGMISGITLVDSDVNFDITHDYGFYKSFGSFLDQQNSGAYIFRPSKPNENLTIIDSSPNSVRVLQTELLTEVRTQFNAPWIKQVVKIYPDRPYLDIEYSVGPIPIETDRVGKEIVSRLCTGIQSNGTFFTDSNGREFLLRKRLWNEYENIASNYYPINTAIYIQDDRRSFAVLTDRSQGGGSQADGCIEIMLHRRTVYDDARGVGEPINETDEGMTPYPPYGDAKRKGNGIVLDGMHRLVFAKSSSENHIARPYMDSMFSAPIMFSSEHVDLMNHGGFGSLVNIQELPKNIQIVTLQRWESDSILIRLAHQYDKSEDIHLSQPVMIDLSNIFIDRSINDAVELTLSGNQDRSEWEHGRKMKWIGDEGDDTSRRSYDDSYVVQLNPLDIRTFKITFK